MPERTGLAMALPGHKAMATRGGLVGQRRHGLTEEPPWDNDNKRKPGGLLQGLGQRCTRTMLLSTAVGTLRADTVTTLPPRPHMTPFGGAGHSTAPTPHTGEGHRITDCVHNHAF